MAVSLHEPTKAFQKIVEVQTSLFEKLDEDRAGGRGGGKGSESGTGGEGGNDKKKEVLLGKGFEMMDKFGGGEAEWNEWSGDFRTVVQTKNEMAGEALIYVKTAGKAETNVMDWAKVVESIKEAADYFEENEVEERFKELGKASKELYRWLRLKTQGATQLVVLAEEDKGDRIKVWGLQHVQDTTIEQCQG